MIEKRKLGNTGIELSPIGFGCASIWGSNLITDAEAIKLFETAYDLGITYYDTGHSYGIAEERIGKVLRNGFVKRDECVISTKFGTRVINGKNVHDASPTWILKSVETSLKRMKTDYIDCLSLHGSRVDDFTDEFFDVLYKLKESGKVRTIGASTSNNKQTISFINDHNLFDYVFIRYNILNQDLEPLILQLNKKGKGIIAGAPLAESLYCNRIFHIRSKKDIWYLGRTILHFRKEFLQGRKYTFINKVDGMSGAQVALRYVLNNKCVSSAVVGTSSIEHLKDNLKVLDMEIPKDILARIRKA